MTHLAADESTNLHRLQPLRVLLSGRDRRFVRVTSFLLSRRGYDVALAGPRNIVEAAAHHRADVVLLETADSRVNAARNVAALQAMPIAPSVLVVFGDGDDERWTGLLAVRKWTPVDLLAEAIEDAALRRPAPLAESGPL